LTPLRIIIYQPDLSSYHCDKMINRVLIKLLIINLSNDKKSIYLYLSLYIYYTILSATGVGVGTGDATVYIPSDAELNN
jgi:uncharacterized membrane protein